MNNTIYNKRYILSRRALIFWTLFIGIGAVGGAVAMFIDPLGKTTGMSALLPFFQVLPFADRLFKNLIFPGIALLIVNGLTNLTAAALLFGRKKIGEILGGIFGVTLMLWITIQFVILPPNFMSSIYFVFGIAQAITGALTLIGRAQSEFAAALQAEIAAGKATETAAQTETQSETQPAAQFEAQTAAKKSLVVYFSRHGYVKRIARELAREKNAELFELTTRERTFGNAGFWWCGRFGMLRRPMPIEKLPENLETFEDVYVCFPVWVFTICAPVRDFLMKSKGKIKKIHYVSVHFMNVEFKNLAAEADALAGTKHVSYQSVRCRFGKFKKVPGATKRSQ